MPMSFGGISKSKVATVIVAIDGSGDTTDIQTGINLLPAGGGVVYIKEGTYTITDQVNINKDNVSIRGAGYATEIITTDDVTMIYSDKDYITIDGLRLTGAGAGHASNIGIELVGCTDVSIYNIFIMNIGSNGINISDLASVIRLWKVEVLNSVQDGVYLTLTMDIILESIAISNSGRYGIHIDSAPPPVMIKSVYCDSNVKSQIFIDGSNNVNIIGGFIDNGLEHGIHIVNGSEAIISGNRFKENDYDGTDSFDGIFLDNSDRCIISNNLLKFNDRYQINISNNTCNDNLIIGNLINTFGVTGGLNDSGTDTIAVNNIEKGWA